MKILITGTAGFIGFHLAKKMLERGDEIVGLDSINDYYDVNLKFGRLKETGIAEEKIERSEEYTSELQSRENLVCRLLLEKKNVTNSGPNGQSKARPAM